MQQSRWNRLFAGRTYTADVCRQKLKPRSIPLPLPLVEALSIFSLPLFICVPSYGTLGALVLYAGGTICLSPIYPNPHRLPTHHVVTRLRTVRVVIIIPNHAAACSPVWEED